jgi:hypothetical protein
VSAEDGVLAYARELAGREVLIVLNMTNRKQVLQGGRLDREALLSTYMDDLAPSDTGEIHLRANEGLVLRMLPDDL